MPRQLLQQCNHATENTSGLGASRDPGAAYGVDRSTRDTASRFDALLYARHHRLVNGYFMAGTDFACPRSRVYARGNSGQVRLQLS
jgi:hypothetical protein